MCQKKKKTDECNNIVGKQENAYDNNQRLIDFFIWVNFVEDDL